MTKEQALILARKILETGDANIGAGIILGALAVNEVQVTPSIGPAIGIGPDGPFTIGDGTTTCSLTGNSLITGTFGGNVVHIDDAKKSQTKEGSHGSL